MVRSEASTPQAPTTSRHTTGIPQVQVSARSYLGNGYVCVRSMYGWSAQADERTAHTSKEHALHLPPHLPTRHSPRSVCFRRQARFDEYSKRWWLARVLHTETTRSALCGEWQEVSMDTWPSSQETTIQDCGRKKTEASYSTINGSFYVVNNITTPAAYTAILHGVRCADKVLQHNSRYVYVQW